MAKTMQKGNRQIQVNTKAEMAALAAKGYEELGQLQRKLSKFDEEVDKEVDKEGEEEEEGNADGE